MARYPEIVSIIKQRIDSGVYTDKLPPLSHLSREFNANINTVQRALTELKNQSCIYSVNGVGSFVAHPSAPADKKIVTLYMRDFVSIRNYRLLGFIEALQKGLQQHDLQLQVAVNDDLPDKENCQGVLVYTWALEKHQLARLKKHIMPEKIYFLERFTKTEQGFGIDNYAAGAEAVEHLYRTGHRKIALIVYSQQPEISFYERTQGALNAAKKYSDLQVKVYDLGDSVEAYCEKVHEKVFPQITTPENMPDAAFVLTDRLALHFIRHCRAQNIAIPDDISIIGYDNEKILQFFEPPLTTFEEPYSELAALVVKRMLNPVCRHEENRQIFCKPLFIERQSVKKRTPDVKNQK